MNLNFLEDGGILVTLSPKRMEDLEINLNGFLDKGGVDEKYNHHDIFEILTNHGIKIVKGGNNDKGPGRDKETNRT